MTDIEYKLNAIEVVEKLINEYAQESIIKNDLDSVEVLAKTKEGMSKLRAKLLTKN